MKKILLTLSIIFSFIITNAQVTSMKLGYCNDEVATKGQIGISGAATIEAAIFLPESTLKLHSGNQIESINAGLATKLNITDLTVWVRSELTGENLAEGTAESIQKGWNDVKLSTPYNIEGNKGLYIGYTFTQKGSAYGISTVGEYKENSIFVKLGEEEEWTTPSEYGSLSIEAIVSGDNLPKFDLELVSTTIKANYPIETQMPVSVNVRNLATETITGFDVECKIDNLDPIVTHIDCELAYNTIETFSFEILPALTELKQDVKMTVTILNLKEGNDQNTLNNYNELTFDIINKEFKRNLLIEEFTTEQCPNCPFGTATLHDALEILEEEFPGQINTVCHHSGYYEDWLTTSTSINMLWLFNQGGSTYAPAFMSDRMGVFSNPGTAEKMANILRNRLVIPSYVGLEIEGEYDNENRLLTVTVTGERSTEFCENPARITVYVVENDIKARNQAGATGEYIHNHAHRASNDSYGWGEEIEWKEDNTFEYTCELTLKAAWLTNNMEIIAFVSDYNSSDATSCVVENSAKIPFTDFYTDSVDSIIDNVTISTEGNDIVVNGEYDNVEVYNINGMKVGNSDLTPGIYIVKVIDNNTSTTTKVVIK